MAGRRQRLLTRVLSATADRNIRFGDLRALLLALGFEERVRGSHHIFNRDGVAEILNLQPREGGASQGVSGAAGTGGHREVSTGGRTIGSVSCG